MGDVMGMILTDEKGRPFERPVREDFELGIEGDIEFMRACHAYKDRVSECANQSFTEGFRAELKRSKTISR